MIQNTLAKLIYHLGEILTRRLPAAKDNVGMHNLGHFRVHDVHVHNLRQEEVNLHVWIGEQPVPDVLQHAGLLGVEHV